MPAVTFASTLDDALTAAPWSLDHIVELLAERNIRVSQSALSHWRSGRSVPKRTQSLRAVTALEELLDLPAHSLMRLLPLSTGTLNSSPQLADETLSSRSRYRSTDREAQFQTDTIAEVQPETLDEETIISADRMSYKRTQTFLVRIPHTGSACMHVTVNLDRPYTVPDAGYAQLHTIEGATLASYETYLGGRVTITRLDLPEDCVPDQLHRVSFSYDATSRTPFHTSPFQTFDWPCEFYTNRIIFKGHTPHTIGWVEETVQEKRETTQTSIFTRTVNPVGTTISVAKEKPRMTRSYFTWQ